VAGGPPGAGTRADRTSAGPVPQAC